MAAVLPNPILSKSKFHNWIKAALAVLFTKEEIEPVVYDEIVQFQEDVKNSLSAGSTCSNCSTENLIKCPTNKICNVKRGKCNYHRDAATQYQLNGCPNKICDHLKSEIQKAHRYNGPSFKNTDAKQWCSNPWEIAKCYMPPDGYKKVTNATDTDFNGINSVIINHKGFDAKIRDDLSKENNIFDQGREVGKKVRHSPNLEVEDVDLTKYFTILNNILTDKGFKAINKSPHNAIQKLTQLQNDELTIGKDVICKVLDDTGKVIQERIRKETEAYKEEAENRNLVLIDLVNTKIKCIEDKAHISLTQLNETLKSSIDELDAKLKEFKDGVEEGKKEIKDAVGQGKKEIKDGVEEGKQEIKNVIEQRKQEIEDGVGQGKQKIKDEVEQGKQQIEDIIKDRAQTLKIVEKDTGTYSRTKEEIYQERKKELKEDLIKVYKKKRSTVPLSPLINEVETNLAGFYVMPDIVLIKQKSLTSHQEERTPVRSLKDLLITKSESQQNIYLSADAGFGKTSFSKYLAITWCQAFCPDSNRRCFKDEELEALANFEFLFLVLLRDSTAVCTIDLMIEQQIIEKIPPSKSKYLLQEVLRREKCLIILDGLDEWTHPDTGCSDQSEKIPHRYSRDNCVILTTTRPWKLGVSNLKTSDIDKRVELVQLSEDSTHQLEKNAIRKMSSIDNDDELKEKTREFDEEIAFRGLKHMQTIPLLLMYITCLWCNKIPIGNSKLEVYINIIEFLLSRTAEKHPKVHPSSDPSHSDIPESSMYTERKHLVVHPSSEYSHSEISEYFKKHNFCEKFYSLLKALAKLAYHTLFNEKRENTLVFDESVAEKYLKADDMKLSLLSGILTESTTTTTAERSSKVSFSHKTVQEFFAAIFISSQSDGQKTVLEKCKNVQSILDMSTICEFLSKMNSKIMCEILPGLMSVINEDEETRKYRTRTDYVDTSTEPLYNIQKMLLSCLQQMTGSENIKLCLQDFFIDKDTIHDKHLQRLSKQNNTQIKSLCINSRYTSPSLRDIIKSFCLTDLNNLHKLYYFCDNTRKNAEFSLLLFPSLKTVSLWLAIWTNDEGKFCERIETLKNVQYLHISWLKLSHEMLKIFYNFISGNKSIKQLTLIALSCIEQDEDCKMMLNLSQHSQLKNVDLEYINHLDESSLLLSRDMLNIERVVLWFIEISGECLQNMVENMKTISHLVTVQMYKIKPETEFERFRNDIRSSQTLDVTRDEIDEFGRRIFEFQTRKPSKE